MHVIGLERLWMTKVKYAKIFKMIRNGRPSSSRYHWTCSSLDDKRDFDSLRIGRVWATICCLHASSDLSSLDDEGADNYEVSPHAIGPSSHDSRIETFLRSRPEDVDISGKGADDHIGLCVSMRSLASG